MVTDKQARIVARRIIEALPDYFRDSIEGWRLTESRIHSIIMHGPTSEQAAEGGAGPSE